MKRRKRVVAAPRKPARLKRRPQTYGDIEEEFPDTPFSKLAEEMSKPIRPGLTEILATPLAMPDFDDLDFPHRSPQPPQAAPAVTTEAKPQSAPTKPMTVEAQQKAEVDERKVEVKKRKTDAREWLATQDLKRSKARLMHECKTRFGFGSHVFNTDLWPTTCDAAGVPLRKSPKRKRSKARSKRAKN